MQTPEDGIRMAQICQTMLEIVAYLEESQYTEENKCQTEVSEHSTLAVPASEATTSQG